MLNLSDATNTPKFEYSPALKGIKTQYTLPLFLGNWFEYSPALKGIKTRGHNAPPFYQSFV